MIQVSPTLTRISVGDFIPATWKLTDSETGAALDLTGYTATIWIGDKAGIFVGGLVGVVDGPAGTVSAVLNTSIPPFSELDLATRARLRVQIALEIIATEVNPDVGDPISDPAPATTGGPTPVPFVPPPSPMALKWVFTGPGAGSIDGSYNWAGTDQFDGVTGGVGAFFASDQELGSYVKTITSLTVTFASTVDAQVQLVQATPRVTESIRERVPPLPYVMLWIDPVITFAP